MARSWNITKQLLDDAIRRRRMLVNVENGIVREMATVFRDVEMELSRKIVDYLGSRDPDTWLTAARRARLLGSMQDTINEEFPRLSRTVQRALREQAKAEADLVLARLAAATEQLPEDIPVYRPSAEQLRELATNGLPKDLTGKMVALDDEIASLRPAASKRVRRVFQEAVVRGDGAARIASSVREAMGVSRNQANVIARTMIQRVSNDSARLAYDRNKHLIASLQWMATLDDRTCVRCGSQDGELFKNGEGPVLPDHYLCRCFLAPVAASWRQLGIPESKATPEIRRLFDGRPAERVNYQTWLRQQPASTQRDILGPTRYDAYAKDGAQLDDFANDRRPLTVAEYKERAA